MYTCREIQSQCSVGQRMSFHSPPGRDWHTGARRKGMATTEVVCADGYVWSAACIGWAYGNVFAIQGVVAVDAWAARVLRETCPDTRGGA